jgi:RNA polymerase sigma factor FliA
MQHARHRQAVQDQDAASTSALGHGADLRDGAPRAPQTAAAQASTNPVGSQATQPHASPAKPERASVCPKVLKSYLPLVNQIVSQIARRLPANVLRDDLHSAGVFGLVDSLRRNGGDNGEAFEWYARTRIRGAVVDELRAQDWLTRRARAAVSAASEDGDARPAALVNIDDVSPTDEAAHLVALEQDPAATVEARDDFRVLARAMEQLPERERRIVGMHYFDGVKFKDIGAELGVSEPRVSQLHARALDRLRSLIHRAA